MLSLGCHDMSLKHKKTRKKVKWPFTVNNSPPRTCLFEQSLLDSPVHSRAFLRQFTWWHFGSRLHRRFRFFSAQKLISGKERIKFGFLNPVQIPRAYLRPWSVLEWRMQFSLDFSNVYATHFTNISHFNFWWNYKINDLWKIPQQTGKNSLLIADFSQHLCKNNQSFSSP